MAKQLKNAKLDDWVTVSEDDESIPTLQTPSLSVMNVLGIITAVLTIVTSLNLVIEKLNAMNDRSE